MRPQLVQVGCEDVVRPEQPLDAHRGSHVGELEERAQVVDGEDEHAKHAVRAVDEGESLLLPQLDRLDPRLFEREGGIQHPAGGVEDGALAHHDESAVRERREVT